MTDSERLERTAPRTDAGLRLDQFWARELEPRGVSRGRVQEWIAAGAALVTGKPCLKPGQRLEGGEALVLAVPPLSSLGQPQAEDGPLRILHRDASLAVLDKPAGLTVHPAPGLESGTLVNRLLHHFPELAPEVSGMDGERPGIVHRLDKDTTGLIVVALTEAARLALSADFAARRVSKTYLAVVHGRPQASLGDPDAGEIDLAIGRHPSLRTRMAVLKKGGRHARTGWRRLWTDRLGRASLVAVRLHTGRTHQIRVHLAHLGHPLVGDPVYGPAQHARWLAQEGPLAALAQRQMLHAFRLALRHPDTGEVLDLRADPPEDFAALLAALAGDCLRVVLTGLPGCGKSSLLRALAALPGAPPVFSADACVAGLYAPGADGAALLARRFGKGILDPGGAVDKPRLLALLVENPGLRREVEDLVHPLVAHALERFWAQHAHRPLALAEVPLFLEAGWRAGPAAQADLIVGLRCPEDVRTGPLRASRGLAPETLAALDSWQWPEERKLAACHIVLDNDQGLEGLAPRAEGLLRSLEAERAARAERFVGLLAGLLDGVAAEPAALEGEEEPLPDEDWEDEA